MVQREYTDYQTVSVRMDAESMQDLDLSETEGVVFALQSGLNAEETTKLLTLVAEKEDGKPLAASTCSTEKFPLLKKIDTGLVSLFCFHGETYGAQKSLSVKLMVKEDGAVPTAEQLTSLGEVSLTSYVRDDFF